LRADAERDATRLRRTREISIDLRSFGGAAGHPGDHERRGEPLADQLGRQIDVVDGELRQGLMDQLNVLEQRRAHRLCTTRGRHF